MLKDLTGQRFGRLVIIKRAEVYIKPCGQRTTRWLCKCDCGNEIIVFGYSLKSGNTKSCGCFNIEKCKERSTTHNLSKTRLYNIWGHIITRCYNKKYKRYNDWGGRGITMCDEWRNDFVSFYNWSINNNYKDDLTIDRIDVNGNYCPENCRFVDVKTQNNNRRDNIYININGDIKTFSQWCDYFNLNYNTCKTRLRQLNWNLKKVFNIEKDNVLIYEV